MSYSRNTTCASCTRFPRAALEGDGRGFCSGWDEQRSFDYPACVLHMGSKSEDERKLRRDLVERLKNEQ